MSLSDNWKKDYPSAQNISEEGLDENHSLKKMLRLVGENKRVIDFGCATGYFSQLLTRKGCRVTGIEINPDAAKVAELYCEQVIVADLDFVSLTDILPIHEFDVAIFGDVLEHLRDPWRVLEETKQLLKSEGCIVTSIPNIAHGAIRLALLEGKFEYTELGILDNTHLRFFTRKTVEELFKRSGYFIDVIDSTKLPIFSDSSLVPNIDTNKFNREFYKQIEEEEGVDDFQFVVRAFSSSQEGKNAALNQRYKLICQLEHSQSQLQHTQAELECRLQQASLTQSQVHQTQAELNELQSQMQHTQAELERCLQQASLTQSQMQQALAQRDQTQAQLQQTQEQLTQTQAQLQQPQEQLIQTQAQLQQTQAQLTQVQAQLQQTQAQLTQVQAQLQQTQAQSGQTQAQLQQTQAQSGQTHAQLQQTQDQLEQTHAIISGMESSKFWKLRTAWVQIKRTIGLTNTSPPILAGLSPQTTDLSTIAISEINNLKEINLIAAGTKSQSGYLDGINGSSTTKIAVPKATSLIVSGWAILADEGEPADGVIITYGDNNSLAAVAPVNVERLDVVEALQNSVYKNSGWNATFNSSTLPTGKVVIKAWAYNSAKKEARQLNPTPTIEVLPFHNEDPYFRWLSKNFPRNADLSKMAETVNLLGYKPKLSVIVPVYNPPERFLREAIESVLNQVYPYWELCIADDASTKSYVKSILEEYTEKDPRIKVVFRTENGHISHASNSALEIATGEFVAFLDHDDLLTPDALYEVALMLNLHPNADMIYSDEDKVDEDNYFKDPFFKPEWCPDSFLSRMYTCHLGTYRHSLVMELGGFRAGYEGSQDYDLVLRLTEKTSNIFHIPKILYHWRTHAESTASGPVSIKSYAYKAAEKTLNEAIYRRGERGQVTGIAGLTGNYTVRYEIQNYKLVSIIIPTRNLGNILDKCLKSIFEKSIYPNYEVLVIDNGSTEEDTAKIIADWMQKEPNRFRCCQYDIPFNYSKINNYAVTQAKGEYLLFLNNDTEVLTPDWIDAMVEQAQRSSIGTVGALLLYPDNSIQHAGIVLGLGGVAAHSHRHFPHTTPGYFCQVGTINNFSALTGACLMCRREVYEDVAGFDEKLAVAYNDVDLCLKIMDKGYRNVYLPHVILYHYESKSRGYEDTTEKIARIGEEAKYLRSKWEEIIDDDPCYSPHLTREREDYSINA